MPILVVWERIWPEEGCSSPLMQRRRVDFPLPLGPMMTMTSPFWTSRLMFLRIWFEPKDLDRFLMDNMLFHLSF